MAIALVHAAFGLAVFSGHLRALLREGLFDTIGEDPMRGAVAWFMLFALPLFGMGQLVHALERSGEPVPRGATVSLTVLVVLGVTLMPGSGFWLAAPPLVSLWHSNLRAGSPATASLGG